MKFETKDDRIWAAIRRYSHVNWALADQVVVSSANFLTGVLIARSLGIAEFGRFSLAWMLVQFVQSIQYAVVCSPLMSIAPKIATEERDAYYTGIIFHQIVFALISVFATVIAIYLGDWAFSDWHLTPIVWPLSAVVLTSQSQDFIRRYFFSLRRPGVSFISDVVRYGTQLALLLWLFRYHASGASLPFALTVISAAAGLGGLIGALGVRLGPLSRIKFVALTSRHWHYSRWLLGSALFSWTSGNLLIIASGVVLGTTAVGVLRAGQSIIGVTHIFFQGLENVLPVQASIAFANGGFEQLIAFTRKSVGLIMLATVSIAAIAWFFPNAIMTAFYGKEFSQIGWVLQVYALIYVILAFGLALSIALRAVEKTSFILYSYALGTLFSIVGGIPLIMLYGVKGALIGLVITTFINAAVPFFGLISLAKAHRPKAV